MRNRAVFLDRDGVLIKDVPDICKIGDVHIFSFSADAVKIFNELNLLAIIATNQPQIAKGFCTEETVRQINDKIVNELKKRGARIDTVYYCPHHPEKGFLGERPEYKIECTCRKPKIGMIEQAMKRFDIDLSRSFIIGNTSRDVETGENVKRKYPGFRTILIGSSGAAKVENSGGYLVAANLLKAAKLIRNLVEARER